MIHLYNEMPNIIRVTNTPRAGLALKLPSQHLTQRVSVQRLVLLPTVPISSDGVDGQSHAYEESIEPNALAYNASSERGTRICWLVGLGAVMEFDEGWELGLGVYGENVLGDKESYMLKEVMRRYGWKAGCLGQGGDDGGI